VPAAFVSLWIREIAAIGSGASGLSRAPIQPFSVMATANPDPTIGEAGDYWAVAGPDEATTRSHRKAADLTPNTKRPNFIISPNGGF
jgi:hypothetical protein